MLLSDRAGEGQALKSIGVVYLNLQQYEKAIALFQQSLAIAREIKNQDLEALSLYDLGNAYARLQKPEQAIAFYQQSLAVSRLSQNWTKVRSLNEDLSKPSRRAHG